MSARFAKAAALVLAGLLLAPAGRAQDEGDARPAGAAVSANPILLRTPDSLPRAPEGRWEGWSRTVEPPASVAAHVQRAGDAYFDGRDYPKALEELYAMLELEPDFPPALHMLGTVYFRLHRYGDGALALERFVEVVPGELAETQALGHCYYSVGRYADARAHYERVLAGGNTSLETVRGLGLSKLRLGDPEGALDDLRKVVEGRPEHGDAWAWIAQILYDLDRAEEALEPAQKGVQFAAYEPRPWFVLSRVQSDLGLDEEAAASFARFQELTELAQGIRYQESVLALDPHNAAVLRRLVEQHALAGNLGAVRGSLARLYQVSPDDCEMRFWSLEVLLALGDEEAARVAAKALEEACGDDVETWRRLELFYGRIRDVQEQLRCGELYLRRGGSERGRR